MPAGDRDLREALDRLNRAAAALSGAALDGGAGVHDVLRLIAAGAVEVAPGTSAVACRCDLAKGTLDWPAQASAGEHAHLLAAAASRDGGLGARAIARRRRVLSCEEHDLEVGGHAAAVACFPLVAAGQALGALYVYQHGAQRFDELELLVLDNLVSQAAMAIHHARRLAGMQRDLARREDELSRLRRAGLLISAQLGLEETLQAILQMAMEVTNARYGIFRLLDRGGQNLVTRALAGDRLSRPLVQALPLCARSVMGWVAEHREPLLIRDLREEPWAQIYLPLDHDLEMRSELAVPLVGAGGRLEGVLNLESPAVSAFSTQDSHLLQALATQAVVAIQDVRLLDALQEVAERLLSQPCTPLLAHLAELARDLLNAAAGAVWVLDGEGLVLRAASAGHRHGERLPLHGSLVGQAVLTRRPVTADDVRSDPRFNRPDLAREHNWGRALVVPMLAGDERTAMGALSVYSTAAAPGRLTESEWDAKVLTCLAHYAALGVHNAARQEALRAAQEQRAVAETFAAVGDIAANLLHQLNNKVGTIPVRVEGIEDKCRPAIEADPYLAENLAEIERSANEAMEAVRENLFHLRPIRLVPVDVATCVATAVADAHLPPALRVTSAGLAGLPPVVAAERSLTLVFANLLDNAREATRGEGTVAISGSARDGWVEVTVADSGPGIAPGLHGRIFELAFSGSAAHPGKLGFGLWWVKTLMARLGGSAAVESDGHSGTTFRLRLPQAEAAQ